MCGMWIATRRRRVLIVSQGETATGLASEPNHCHTGQSWEVEPVGDEVAGSSLIMVDTGLEEQGANTSHHNAA
jgi:hypothetical protein